MPAGDPKRPLRECVGKFPGVGKIMTFGKRGLEEQLELLGRTVLYTSQLCVHEPLGWKDEVWLRAWLSPYTVAATSM